MERQVFHGMQCIVVYEYANRTLRRKQVRCMINGTAKIFFAHGGRINAIWRRRKSRRAPGELYRKLSVHAVVPL
jgi:hypothetical protein